MVWPVTARPLPLFPETCRGRALTRCPLSVLSLESGCPGPGAGGGSSAPGPPWAVTPARPPGAPGLRQGWCQPASSSFIASPEALLIRTVQSPLTFNVFASPSSCIVLRFWFKCQRAGCGLGGGMALAHSPAHMVLSPRPAPASPRGDSVGHPGP